MAPTAMRMGLRSEIGLAVIRFPPMDWGEGEEEGECSLGGGGVWLAAEAVHPLPHS